LFFLSYSLQYPFSVLCACCLNDNILSGGSILVKSVWCPRGFLYLNRQNFLELWEIFCSYLIEYITYTFGLDHFSSMLTILSIWSVNAVTVHACSFHSSWVV
jgi:hypothetical protein